MPGPATTPCFPSVAHVRRPPRKNEILAMSVVHVAARHYVAAVLHRGEIDFATAVRRTRTCSNLAVYAKTRDATIRKDVEPQVRRGLVALDLKFVLCVALQSDLGKQRSPHHVASAQPVRRRSALDYCCIDACTLGIIAGEPRCVDHHSAHVTRRSEPNDRPVMTKLPPATGLPAIHPLAALSVNALTPLWRTRLQERLLWSEKLVVRGND